MATLEAIRDAIKTTVEAGVSSLQVYDTVPGDVNLPAVVVVPAEADFLVAMGRGTDTWQFDLWVLCSHADSKIGQDALDEFVTGAGSKSIRQAIFNARTLGLSNTDAHVAGMSGYGGRLDVAGIDHVAAVLRLVVHTRGTE